MNSRRAARIVERLEAEYSELLNVPGFDGPIKSQGGEDVFWRWERRRAWRQDVYELWHYAGEPESIASQISVGVIIEGVTRQVDGGSVPYMLFGRQRLLDLPGIGGFLAARFDDSLVARVMDGARRSLDWFERFATPALCLEELRRTDRNGMGVGTEPYVLVTELLARLHEEGR